MNRKIVVSGVGCCLLDRIFNAVSFSSPRFQAYLSRRPSDGGLVPGKLEFEEEFERFAGWPFPEVLEQLTEGRGADCENIGGPCIVGLIHAAQLTQSVADVHYYGCRGGDKVGEQLMALLGRTPVQLSHYGVEAGFETASTSVFSDPDYDEGHGERIFVNTIGASWRYLPQQLPEAFFQSDICFFGATALVPPIHEALDGLLPKAKSQGAFTLVTTVYDNLSERRGVSRWPLGTSDESYRYIDLLVTDREEALRLSGMSSVSEALDFFRRQGVGAAVVTDGSREVRFFASSPLFGHIPETAIPVSAAVTAELKQGRRGDTTGCGDNFAGGMLASLVWQMEQGRAALSLMEACCWGVVSGGYACFYVGGTWFESAPGEKLSQLKPYYDAYVRQLEADGLIDNPINK